VLSTASTITINICTILSDGHLPYPSAAIVASGCETVEMGMISVVRITNSGGDNAELTPRMSIPAGPGFLYTPLGAEPTNEWRPRTGSVMVRYMG
jgi:hypothetical protein